MGLVIRQSLATSVISYVGVIIGYVNLLYLYPRFLSPDQVGLLRTIQDAAILFTPFAQFGISQSIIRYFPVFSKDKNQSGSFISLMLLLTLAGFAVFFLAFAIFREAITSYFESNAKEFVSYATLTLWLTLILLLTSVLEAYSRSLLRTVIPNVLREVVIRLLFALMILAYFLGYLNFDQFILSTVGSYLVCLALLVLYLWRTGDFRPRLNFGSLKSETTSAMVRFSLFGFAGTAAMIVIGKMDSLMVSGLMGLAANAVYTTAFYVATVIEIPKRALSQITMPLISRAFEKNDFAEIRTLYRKTAITQFIIGSLLLLGVWANLNNLFDLMPRSEIYSAGRWVVIIIGIGKLTDMLFGPSSEIIILSKYYTFNILLIVLLAVMTVVLNNTLIPVYGIEGAAYGAAISLGLFNVIKFIFIWVKLGIQPFSSSFIKVILIGGVAWFVHWLIPPLEWTIVDIIVRSAAIALAYGSLILWTNVLPEANELVRKALILLRLR